MPASKKPKLVRDSFTIPKAEFAAIDTLKERAIALGLSVKKSELLRAGLMALQAMSDASLKAALAAVPTLKTGRPAAPKTKTVALPANPQRGTKPTAPAVAKAPAAPKAVSRPAAPKAAARKTIGKAKPPVKAVAESAPKAPRRSAATRVKAAAPAATTEA